MTRKPLPPESAFAKLRPDYREIATIGSGRDITRPYIDSLGRLLLPEDEVLLLEGGLPWGRRYALYEKVLQDWQVKSCIQQRITAITQAETEVIPGRRRGMEVTDADQRAADFIKEQLENLDWDGISERNLYGSFYGFSASELMYRRDDAWVALDADRGGIRVRNRGRFTFDADFRLRLLVPGSPYGELLPERKFWTWTAGSDHSDDPFGKGLAHWLYWPVWFKRNGIKFWLSFLELFANPKRRGKYPANATTAEQNTLLEMLDSLSTDSSLIHPEGIEVDYMEARRSGTADYSTLDGKMDAAIAKVILSQTMTTDNGSSLSQAQVHEGVGQAVKKSDSDLLHNSFNAGPVKWLIDYNRAKLGDCAYPNVWRRIEPEEEINDRAERDTKIYQVGYRPTPELIERTYGEGYEPIPQIQPLVSLSDSLPGQEAAFAAPPTTADIFTDQLAQQTRPLFADWIAKLRQELEASGDLDAFARRLDEVFPELDSSQMQAIMGEALYATRLAGIFEAQEGFDA